MENMKKTDAFWKPALRLGFPVAMQNLLASSAGLVDVLMVGQLGDVPVAAVGMASQWAWLMHVIFYGVSSGASVFLSQYWGAKDMRGIRHSYGILAVAMLAVGAIMTCSALFFPTLVIRIFTSDPSAIETGAVYLRYAGYSYIAASLTQISSTVLRSTEQVRLPLVGSIVSVIGNVVLNYALIFGKFGFPQMGVAGAALATSISMWLGVITVIVVSVLQRNMLIAPPSALFSFDKAFVKRFIRISSPAFINEVLWSVGTTGYNMVYGRMGTIQFAAITIFRTVEGLFSSFYIGLCHACAILVGREIGAGRIPSAITFADRFTRAMPLLSVCMGTLMVMLRNPVLSLFDVSAEVRDLTRAILLLFAINIPIRNLSYITVCGIFRPGGDTNIGLKYDICTIWCFALPLTCLFGLVLKLDFLLVYALMLVMEDWPKAFVCLRRLRSRVWIKPIVQPLGEESGAV